MKHQTLFMLIQSVEHVSDPGSQIGASTTLCEAYHDTWTWRRRLIGPPSHYRKLLKTHITHSPLRGTFQMHRKFTFRSGEIFKDALIRPLFIILCTTQNDMQIVKHSKYIVTEV